MSAVITAPVSQVWGRSTEKASHLTEVTLQQRPSQDDSAIHAVNHRVSCSLPMFMQSIRIFTRTKFFHSHVASSGRMCPFPGQKEKGQNSVVLKQGPL